jgi:hypothetical protein
MKQGKYEVVLMALLLCFLAGCEKDEPVANYAHKRTPPPSKQESVLYYSIRGYSFEEHLPTAFDDMKWAKGIWLVLNVYVCNYDSVPVSVPPMYLKDDRGRLHESTYIGLKTVHSEELTCETLNPGVSTSGYLVFDVPDPKITSGNLTYTFYATDGKGAATYIRIN